MTSNKLVSKFLRSLLGDSAAWARRLRRDIAQTERLLRLTTHDLALITELVNELEKELNALNEQRGEVAGYDDAAIAKRDRIANRLTSLGSQHDRLRRNQRARNKAVIGLTETLDALKADLRAYQASSSTSESTPPPRSGQLSDMLDGDDDHDEPQGPPRVSRFRTMRSTDAAGRTSAHDM